MSINVLITSASRKVSLVKAFQQALTDEGGGEVIAIDANPRSAALYFADQHYIVQQGTGKEYIERVISLCQEHDIRVVVPTRDEELPVFAAAKEMFHEMGVTVMVPDLSVVRTCQDKRLFIEFCIQNDFSIPKTYRLDEIPSRLQFPLFIRGRFGKGSTSAFRINTQKDLDYYLTIIDDPIIQECINAQEYTIDLFADFKGKIISVVPRQRLSVLSGESFIGSTSKINKLIDESMRLAHALMLTGHNTIQCFLHENQVLFIEVNPRYGGGANLGFASGACTPRYLVQIVKGIPVHPHIGEFKDHYLMLRYTEDIFFEEPEV